MMFKAFPLTVLWSVLLNFERTNDDLMLKMRLISSEICPETSPKLAVICQLFFGKVCPKIPVKSADFSANLSLKIPQNVTFFSRPIRSPD